MQSPIEIKIYKSGKVDNTLLFWGRVSERIKKAILNGQKDIVKKCFPNIPSYYLGKKKIKGGADAADSIPLVDEISCPDDIPTKDTTGGDDTGEDMITITDADIDDIIEESATKLSPKSKSTSNNIQHIWESIYPEDNIFELKQKIAIHTNIPIYKQHLFYKNEDEEESLPYHLISDGILHVKSLDIYTASDDEKHLGIPIDKQIFQIRDDIKVEAYDKFTLTNSIHDISIINLDEFVKPVEQSLNKVDEYTLDLIYYGFIIKYFPMMTREIFEMYCNNEEDLKQNYPDMVVQNKWIETFKLQGDIINSHKKIPPNKCLSMVITRITGTLTTSHRFPINLRNLADKIQTTTTRPIITVKIEHNNRKYMVIKQNNNIKKDAIKIPNTSGLNIIVFKSQSVNLTQSHYDNTFFWFINVSKNGEVKINSSFHESAGMNFESIINEIIRIVNPVVNIINSFGKFAMHKNIPTFNKTNVQFKSIDAALLWKRVISANKFKILRDKFTPLLQSQICTTKGTPTNETFEFVFKKGMHKFDLNTITSSFLVIHSQPITNFYMFLSNSSVKNKWENIYHGRSGKCTHKTTYIKFDVKNIREEEFQIFQRYIEQFLHRISPDMNVPDSTITSTKRLWRLREGDPELYNLRTQGKKRVYSILCQNPRQPLIFAPEEYESLNKTQKAKLIKYHNHTYNRPAYYSCPNPKYPVFSFITGEHPKKYCLPCCSKKTSEDVDSKKSNIISKCMETFSYTDTSGDEKTKYQINYNKLGLKDGRFFKLPQIMYNLFNKQYVIMGYKPRLNINKINMTVIDSMGKLTDIFFVDLVHKITTAIKKKQYELIMHGKLIGIMTKEELIKYLTLMPSGNIPDDQNITSFDWNGLFLESLADINYHPIVFEDVHGSIMLTYHSVGERQCLLFKHDGIYYPIVEVDTSANYAIKNTIFTNNEDINQLIAKIENMSHRTSKIVKEQMYIEEFVRKHPWSIEKYIMNYKNRCIAVLLKHEIKETFVYWSIPESQTDANKEYKEDFLPFNPDEYVLWTADFIEWADSYSKYCKIPYIIKEYIGYNSKIQGVNVLWGGEQYFSYLKDTAAAEDKEIKELRYNIAEVNKSMMLNEDAEIDLNLPRIYYIKYLYKLFIMEFINYVNLEKNEEIRKQLNSINAKTVINIQKEIKKIVPEGDDRTNIIETIRNNKNWKEEVENRSWNFDNITLRKIDNMSFDDVIKFLNEYADNFSISVDSIDDINIKYFDNIYIPCQSASADYCDSQKLKVVGRPEMIKQMANDLKNDLKRKYMFSYVFTNNVVEYFDFSRYSKDIVTITEIV